MIYETRRSMWDWLGWAAAAAACIVLAVNIYTTRVDRDISQIPVPTPTPQETLTPERKRQRLIDSPSNVFRASWSAGNVKELASNIVGDVVWSDAEQAGYVRVQGLPVNDPSKETYQLWIFDENQDPKTPIDGGTFNINSADEVVIPIDARLKAKNPKIFAVTIEKPGGVVVSKQERVAAIAKLET